MNNKFIDETKSRQAESGDPETRGPGVPSLQGGGHAPDAVITLPTVLQPRDAGKRGDQGVRGPEKARVPSQRGNAPHADQHLHGDTLPSPEADTQTGGYEDPWRMWTEERTGDTHLYIFQ